MHIRVENLDQVREAIGAVGSGDYFFFDVDQTIINPDCMIAHSDSLYRFIFDRLKELAKEGGIDPRKCQEIMGVFRSQRHEKLIEDEFPDFLAQLRGCGVKTRGLTKMNTGEDRHFPDTVEKWRYDILEGLGVKFSESEAEERLTEDGKDYMVNYRDIIITGKYPKDETLDRYFGETTTPSRIIMMDDKVAELRLIESYAAETEVPVTCLHYQGLGNFHYGEFDEELAELQAIAILKYGILLQGDDLSRENFDALLDREEILSDAEIDVIIAESRRRFAELQNSAERGV